MNLRHKTLLCTPLGLLSAAVLAGTADQCRAESEIEQRYATIGKPALSRSNLSTGGGMLFEVGFDPVGLGGDLTARAVSKEGDSETDVYDNAGRLVRFNGRWRARDTVDRQSSRTGGGAGDTRVIITSGYDSSRELIGRRFIWDHTNDGLTYDDGSGVEDMKSLIDPDASAQERLDETFSDPIVDWVRGNDRNEGDGSNHLRRRRHVLGNMVHSAPQFIGPPFRHYDFDGYDTFRSRHATRVPLVYAGGNDGMLHGFGAIDGKEIFAYIPHSLLGRLHQLTARNYQETFMVDGTPTIADAYGHFSTCEAPPCWHTVLVGSLGSGGNTLFALNVTDPVLAAASGVADENVFLWEYSDRDLGRTTARPMIARLGDGTWTAIFGNGRGAGKVILYVLRISDGTLIQKLEVASTGGRNGLSTPAGWDSDFDGDVDYIYAGDLEGNLWRFDFKPATADGGAGISFSGSPLTTVTDPATARALPISTAPIVSPAPGGGLLIHFGTGMNGQDLEHVNGMFGVTDHGTALGTDPELVTHTLEPVIYQNDLPQPGTNRYRVINSSSHSEDASGWRLQLPAGERILSDPVLHNRRVGFTSTDPAAGTFSHNWFTAIDFEHGGAPQQPFLDLNGDGLFDDADLYNDIDRSDPGTPVVSRFLGSGVASAPTPANIAGGRDTVFISHGLESVGASTADAGLPGGVIDQQNFESAGRQSGACWNSTSASGECHTHGYDDVYNVNGVNMRTTGGSMTDPPNVEGATGTLTTAHVGLVSAMLFEEISPDPVYGNSMDTEILLRVVNPFSVDTQALALTRAARGLGAGITAPPASILYQCANGQRIVLPAPEFNLLAETSRTCRARDLLELRVKFNDINALRASLPNCTRDDQPGPVLGDPARGLNTTYRNGALTVQAVRTSDRRVIWENVNFEHFVIDPRDPVLSAEGTEMCAAFGIGTGGGDFVCRTGCAFENELLRPYKNPDHYSGNSGPGGGRVVVENTGGTRLTERISVSQKSLRDGRVSWVEIRR